MRITSLAYGQLRWKSVVNNKLLPETGVSANIMNWQVHPEPWVGPDAIPVTELSTGLTYRAATFSTGPRQSQALHTESKYVTGAVIYVTGSDSFKLGTNLSKSSPAGCTIVSCSIISSSTGLRSRWSCRRPPIIYRVTVQGV
jgi:hypothetical protein